MKNPKGLLVKDVLDLIFDDAQVEIFSDSTSSIVAKGSCDQLYFCEYLDKEVIDIEGARGVYIMINIY